MQVLHAQDELGGQKFGEGLVEELELVEVVGEVAILAKLSHHVQVEGRLEGKEEFEDEGLAGSHGELLNDLSLTHRVF